MDIRPNRHHRGARLAVGLGVVATALLTACSSVSFGTSATSHAPTPSTASGTPSESASADSTDGPPSPTPGSTVRLLAHDSFAVSDDLVAAFEQRTGLHLEILTGGDAGTMVAGAVLAAGAPSADVLFGIDNTLASRALAAGVFAPYRTAAAADLRPDVAGDPNTASGELTPIDTGDVCVNLDDAYFTEHGVTPPATLDDLADPLYKGMLVVEDPATSSPGLAFLLATIARYGDHWKDYWKLLADNDVAIASSWTDAYTGQFSGGGGGGERPLVVSYATSPPAEIVYASDPKPTQPSTSVMTDGCFRQVEYAGVLAGAANPEGAKAVIDWLLSPEVQADVPLSMFVLPALDGVTLPDVFTFAPTIDEPLTLPSDEIAADEARWLDEWGELMDR